jgi:tRNA dimethylallyltransferase
MSIGTAKPDEKELAQIPHHLISHVSIHDTYSVGQYEREALTLLEQLYKLHDIVIVTGGTGLYINAILNGLDTFPDIPTDITDKYSDLHNIKGISHLQELIQQKDPIYAGTVDMSNPHRLIRALSVIEVTGDPFSTLRTNKYVDRAFTPIMISLEVERTSLYDKINHRVDIMMEQGLLAEVSSLLPYKHLRSLQTVGYKEIFQHLSGQWTLDYTISKIKQHTRNYAKRQMTWFRNQGDYALHSPDDLDGMIHFINRTMASTQEVSSKESG